MKITELQVCRDDLGSIAAIDRDVTVGDGEVLLRIDRFALTANNVTYGAHGVDMGYWQFFPADQGKGIVPVWGFATVVESLAEGIADGTRYYGYWPMASHALLLPARVSPRGFTDAAAHRLPLPPVYNNYVVASADFGPETIQALFRPLYTTSFVLDVMLAEHHVDTLVLTSASSKTALGLAQAAKGRQRIIGLTSAVNRDFVVGTGYYDDIFTYDDIAALGDMAGRFALVDFSGNGVVRHAVHATLGERLVESHVAGDTHWDTANTADLPGVQAQLFFAPSVIVERIAQWGAEGFEARLAAAWQRFIASTGWLEVVEASGAEAVAAHWQAVSAGQVDPAQGLVLTV
ncbi:DUF2855 family protein [Sandarakinorhabdus sp. DWP1-3-1]|uniref:DUF2855 family protein n=1 Tax=Sandarakinorhabdus sp. DWP1-3-1 TaxID=2804627 RepID=UPI003CF530E3